MKEEIEEGTYVEIINRYEGRDERRRKVGRMIDSLDLINEDIEIEQGRLPEEGRFHVGKKPVNKRLPEQREENILVYETAIDTVPILSSAIWLKANLLVAYGYTFKYETDERLKKIQLERIKFLNHWARFVNLTEVIKQISACMNTFGEAFVEKVYDTKGYAQGGWGIRKLKVIHPYTVEIVRDEYGKVINYIQQPSKIRGGTGVFSSLSTGGKDDGKMERVAPPHAIVHFKARDMTNKTYGKSKIRPLIETLNIMMGIEDDIADIIRTTARPLTVWRMGDAENPMSVKYMRKISSMIMSGLAQGSDIAIDGRVTVEVVESGKNITYVEPFMSYIQKQIISGLGIPDTFFGLTGANNTEAEMKEEMFRRLVMAEQKYISDKFINEVFRDIFLFQPNELKNRDAENLIRERVTYKKYKDIPIIRFSEIENISNRRLRVESELMGGAIDMLEAKEEFGRNKIVREEYLHPQLQMYLAQAEYYRKQAQMMEKESKMLSSKPKTNNNED